MTFTQNWQTLYLFSVFIDGEYVCQVYAVNQIHAVWKAKGRLDFSKATEKFTDTSYVITACRASEPSQELLPSGSSD